MTLEGAQINEQSKAFYAKNQDLLLAHTRASMILADANIPVSGQMLTELARYLRNVGYSTFFKVLNCYKDLHLERESEDWAINNNSVAWLARTLSSRLNSYPGFRIQTRKSKLDDVVSCNE